MRLQSFSFLLPLIAIGCTEPPATQEANFDETDEDLALLALQALGADVEGARDRRCQSCHSVSRAKVKEWLELTERAEQTGCMPKSARRYLYQPRVLAERIVDASYAGEALAVNAASEVVGEITVTDLGDLHNLTVEVTLRHERRGDVTVWLQKDELPPVALHDRIGGGEADVVATWDQSDEFSGVAAGTYRLRIENHAEDLAGRLESWKLALKTVERDVDENLAALNPDYQNPTTDMTQEQALAMVDCLRVEPNNANSPFFPAQAGIETIRAHERNSHFRRLFKRAYSDDETYRQQLGDFARFVKMPRGAYFDDSIPDDVDDSYTVAMRKEEYWTVREWFDRGMKDRDQWDAVLESVLEEVAPPSTCTPHITDQLRDYVVATARGGWTRKNAEEIRFRSFGCPPPPPEGTDYGWPESALECFPSSMGYDEQASWAADHEGSAKETRVIELRALDYRTSFWTRSSADGRFVANGRSDGPGSFITDLQREMNIPVSASYDPGFAPDNSYFVFQGTPVGAGFCPQNMLLAPEEGEDGALKMIDFKEPGCSGTRGIRLYQHHGESLDGGMSFTANGDYSGDNGGHSLSSTTNPGATAGPNAKVKITPIKPEADGGYTFYDAEVYATPFEGDTVISPTSKVISARLSGGREQLGMTLRIANILERGENDFSVSLSEPSTVCVQGGKSAHSYDDRFMVIHAYSEIDGVGKADVFIVDLFDGETHQVTDMPAGQYALYPHFRSDGWLYFLVRNANPDPNQEHVGATDVALRIESAKPINDVSW